MLPRILTETPMKADTPLDTPMTFVICESQGNVHLFIPESANPQQIQMIANNLSRRTQQPVSVFHDKPRHKFRFCPLPARSTVDTSGYGSLCFSCDSSDPQPQAPANNSTSSDSEDGASEHIPRPRNSWILYRQYRSSQLKGEYPGITASELSKLISAMWKNEPPSEREFWSDMAAIEDRRHKEKYPDYKYSTKKSAKKGKKAAKTGTA